MAKGLNVVAIRHPMPYGNLAHQKVQRFAEIADLKKHDCTIEEMEEYEPHVVRGNVIYAGADYEAIVRAAEERSLTDATSSYGTVATTISASTNLTSRSPSSIPHRPGHELSYYPGEVNLRTADVVIINKIDSADLAHIEEVRANIDAVNPDAIVVDAASTLTIDDASVVRGKRVLAVEDGPTLTHGGMRIGAGMVAASKYGATEFVDPRPWLVGSLNDTFDTYPEIGELLPAMGYGAEQLSDLEKTIDAVDCDSVVIGTPIDLSRVVNITKPHTRVHYDLQEIGMPDLDEVLTGFARRVELV